MFRNLVFVVCALLAAVPARSAIGEVLPEIDVHTSGMERHGGYFPVYWDDSSGKILLEIASLGSDFLFVTALESGLGSNPVGLDRGQLGESVVCRWRRVGRRVILEQRNTKFRAEGASDAARRAVADSFAPSILWAGDMVAEDEAAVLVDVTSLVLSDRHGISGRLLTSRQGDYSLDQNRSLPAADALTAFPENTELSALLTFSASSPGSEVEAVAANGRAFTIRQRLSFIRLPEPGYERRPWDPRIGAFHVDFADYGAALDQPLFRSLMVRHRLELQPDGSVTEPIVYFVDSAAPEPVRKALVEGASWWGEAFAAVGFPDGFRVEVAPEGMDPLDVRFNYIQWVHRQTRGWSYGSTVEDPRTGEIIKGHVTLGSLRVRQDRLLLENLFSVGKPGSAKACGMQFPESQLAIDRTMKRQDAVGMALARIRQLAAHEVGHTLGVAHNFAASTYGDRASVMDYPAPLVRVVDGKIDVSNAYAVGLGIWDLRTIDYMYRPAANVDAWRTYVNGRLAQDVRDGIHYISDADARPLGGAHPAAHLWDNGADPIAELDSVLEIRRVALRGFGADVLLDREPQGELVRAFAPLYFYHRYQSEAVAKLVGGHDYSYSMPGDPNAFVRPVDPKAQRRAVDALFKTLSPETLAIDQRIIELLIPSSSSNAWSIESPSGYTSPIFDPLAAAETAASMTVRALLHPARAARLISQKVGSEEYPGLEVILDPLGTLVMDSLLESNPDRVDAIARRVAAVAVNEMIRLASNTDAREDVRAEVRQKLAEIAKQLQRGIAEAGDESPAEAQWNIHKITRFLARPDLSVPSTSSREPPPGSPIGSN